MGRSKDLATGETRFANVSGDTFTGLVNITNTYSSDTTEQLRVSDNTGSKLDFFGHANGTKSIQAYADDGSTFYNLNLQPLGGYVTMPNQPSWHVAINSRTGWTTTGLQKTPYDNVIHSEPTSAYDATTNFRFTAPVAGKYQATISQNGIGDIILYLYKNGAVYHAGEFRDNGSSAWMHNTISTVVTMAANDYLEGYVKLTGSGNAWNGASSTWDSFSGFLIG